MAHAIDGYPGACKNIHGHSYELHVQVNSGNQSNEYIEGIGLAIDFKDIKNIVKNHIIDAYKWSAGKRRPRRYGEKLEVENTGTVQVTHTLDVSNLTLEQLDALEAALGNG